MKGYLTVIKGCTLQFVKTAGKVTVKEREGPGQKYHLHWLRGSRRRYNHWNYEEEERDIIRLLIHAGLHLFPIGNHKLNSLLVKKLSTVLQ
jgi:hypothetical protein